MAGVIFSAIMTFISVPSLKRFNYVGLRLSLTLDAPLLGWMIQPDLAWTAGAFTVVLAVQIVLIAYFQQSISTFLSNAAWARWDVSLSIPVMAAASLLWSHGWVWVHEGNRGDGPLAAVGVGVALLASLAAVPAFLPRGEWFPLPALGAVLLFLPFLTASGCTGILAIAVCYSVLRHLTAGNVVIRHGMLVVARFLATALVAAAMATLIPAYPGKAHFIIAVTGGGSALQLLGDTLLVKTGRGNFFTKYAAAAWALVGTFLVAVLSVLYAMEKFSNAPEPTVMDVLRIEFLLAAVAMGVAVAAYSLCTLPRRGGWSGAELVAAYMICAGMRLLGSAEALHRWVTGGVRGLRRSLWS